MAVEAVGLAASLASLLEISGRIVMTGYGYLSEVAHAPSRMRMVLSEVSSINLVLGHIEEYSAHQGESSTSILYTLFHNRIFEDCKEVLKKIDGTVQTCMAKNEANASKSEVKAFMKRVIWPMKERETEELLKHLDRLRSALSDAIIQDSAASLERLEAMTQQLHKTTINMASKQQHAELMAWVCPYRGDPFDNYQAALKRRQPGTGSWLIESKRFQIWSQRDHGIFWLQGLPGSGKTVLTTTVVEYLQRLLLSKHKQIALAYYYIDYRDPAKQNLEACLANLVKQLLVQNPQGMQELERLGQKKQRTKSPNLTANEYVGIFKVLANLQSHVYVVIDALDEAPDPGAIVDVLHQLSDHGRGTPIAVLLSSRNSANLAKLLIPIVSDHLFISNDDNDDVRQFIATEVSTRFTSGSFRVPDGELINLTISKLAARADGLFLQANLLLDFVFAGKTSRSVRKALNELPNGLEKTYEAILRRITSQNRSHISEIKRSLQWLSMSFVPLTTAMLVEAAAVDPKDTFLDPEALMNETDLIGILSSLVLVDWRQRPPVVSLAHQTVLEYLQSQSILQSDLSQYHIDARNTHHYLAATSIQYLLFPQSAKSLIQAASFQSPQTALQSRHHDPLSTAWALFRAPHHYLLQQYHKMHYGSSSLPGETTQTGSCSTQASQGQALLLYAANLWPEHLKSVKYTTQEFKESMVPRLQWYLNPDKDSDKIYNSWEAFQRRRLSSSLYFVGSIRDSDPLFRQILKSSYFNYIGHESTQNPLFYAILFGLDDCFDLLTPKYNVDMMFRGGWTPLTVAAASGSFGIAKKLLEAGASVNKAADYDERNGLTPLHIAAELAMEDLAELFLAYGASSKSLTKTMTTPFYRAARGGSVKILRLLYEAGSYVNAPIWDNYTPLMETVNWSNHDALHLLLSWGADPNFQSNYGESAIDRAMEVGDESVVKILQSAGLIERVKSETVRDWNEMPEKDSPPNSTNQHIDEQSIAQSGGTNID